MRLDQFDDDPISALTHEQICSLTGLRNRVISAKLIAQPYFREEIKRLILGQLPALTFTRDDIGLISANFATLTAKGVDLVLATMAIFHNADKILNCVDPTALKAIQSRTGLSSIIEILRRARFVPLQTIPLVKEPVLEQLDECAAEIGGMILGQLPEAYVARFRLIGDKYANVPIVHPDDDHDYVRLEQLFVQAMAAIGIELYRPPQPIENQLAQYS